MVKPALPPTHETPFLFSALFLMVSYVFGLNLHNIFHEFGHAVAIWVQGGKVTGFYFHPFDSCLNFSTYVPDHVLLYAGGAFFGGAATIIFPVLAWKYRTPYMMPLVMACAAGFITTARWMLIAPFSEVFTDYMSMIELGTPKFLILISGVISLIVGLMVLIYYLPLSGVRRRMSAGRYVLLFELGILPFHITASFYMLLLKEGRPLLLLAGIAQRALFVALFALVAKWLPARFPIFTTISATKIRIYHAITVFCGIVLLIIVMRFVSMHPEPIP